MGQVSCLIGVEGLQPTKVSTNSIKIMSMPGISKEKVLERNTYLKGIINSRIMYFSNNLCGGGQARLDSGLDGLSHIVRPCVICIN